MKLGIYKESDEKASHYSFFLLATMESVSTPPCVSTPPLDFGHLFPEVEIPILDLGASLWDEDEMADLSVDLTVDELVGPWIGDNIDMTVDELVGKKKKGKRRRKRCLRCQKEEDWTGDRWEMKTILMKKNWLQSRSGKSKWRTETKKPVSKTKRSHLTDKARALLMVMIYDDKKRCLLCQKCFKELTGGFGRTCYVELLKKRKSLEMWEVHRGLLDYSWMALKHKFFSFLI